MTVSDLDRAKSVVLECVWRHNDERHDAFAEARDMLEGEDLEAFILWFRKNVAENGIYIEPWERLPGLWRGEPGLPNG